MGAGEEGLLTIFLVPLINDKGELSLLDDIVVDLMPPADRGESGARELG